MKKVIVILSVCLALLLGLCVFLTVRQEAPAETQPTLYSVQFQVLGTVVSRQTLTEGQLPQTFDADIPGVTVIGWTDPNGQATDPFAAPVTADITYEATAYVALTEHVPYLFADSEGLLRPDEPLDHSALRAALEALVMPEAAPYLPQIAVISSSINRDILIEILSAFYERETIAAAFPEGVELTRSVFARGMNQLLGRSVNDTFEIGDDPVIPADITFEREDAWELLEASVVHTPAQQARSWAWVSSMLLPSSHAPGFMLIEGWLYYVQEDHSLLRDGYVGTLYFNAEGRQTSGDPDLDYEVVTRLKEMAEQNPEADRFALLRIAFDHCHQNYTYRRSYDHPAYGADGWQLFRATDMFQTGKGNCYGFAAMFWALARGLGYDARAVSGTCLSDEQPHSWCLIELDGEDYIFDPQWQYSYTERGETRYDMFMIPQEKFYFWGYKWSE